MKTSLRSRCTSMMSVMNNDNYYFIFVIPLSAAISYCLHEFISVFSKILKSGVDVKFYNFQSYYILGLFNEM